MPKDTVRYEIDGQVAVVTIDRPASRNAVDGPTAAQLARAFKTFDGDERASVAVLTGEGGNFCAGADLKALSEGRPNRVEPDGDGPMGPTRLMLSKPVVAAVEGYAVAGGLELALWCDLRVASREAVFGVFCRRFGVPLIDGGTVRLPRLIGLSHAMDLILTGRPVSGDEAQRMGLVNRLVEPGRALPEALSLARGLCQHPQLCMRADRLSAYAQAGLPLQEALQSEFRYGYGVLKSGEAQAGAARFASGEGRHGEFKK